MPDRTPGRIEWNLTPAGRAALAQPPETDDAEEEPEAVARLRALLGLRPGEWHYRRA